MQTDKEILIAARKRIENPENWFGNGSYPQEGEIKECALVALTRISNRLGDAPSYKLLSKSMDGGIIHFNDSHTHAEVLAAFDRAIAEAT